MQQLVSTGKLRKPIREVYFSYSTNCVLIKFNDDTYIIGDLDAIDVEKIARWIRSEE